MIILHGTWHRTAEDPPTGKFFLWGEANRAAPRRRPRSKRAALLAHPFQAGAEELQAALAELGGGVGGARPLGSRGQRTVLLPSSETAPLASSLLLDDSEPAAEPEPTPALRPWTVDGLILPSGQIALLLALRPEEPDRDPGEADLGPDLHFWGAVSKFALELMARQRFVPSAITWGADGKETLHAVWQPVLDDPPDAQRVALLAEAMPPACRALTTAGTGDAPPPSPRRLILGFLTAVLDDLLREGAGTPRRGRRSSAWEEEAPLSEKWADALLAKESALAASAAERRILQQSLTSWLAPLGRPGEVPPFRTCFRLEAPEGGPGARGVSAPKPKARDWTLRYFLQATDDLSLLIPAAKVWRKSGETLQFLNRRFAQPQEKLLLDLGRAARFFAPIEASLRTTRPDMCELTTAEAYDFLRESAGLLEECGFGVLVPPWWDRARAKGASLGVRVELKAKDDPGTQTGRAFLGLQTLVDYNWQLALGEEPLSPEEFQRIVALKVPLVRVRGQWVEWRPEDVEAAMKLWGPDGQGQTTVAEALRRGLGGEAAGLPVTGVRTQGWIEDFLKQADAGAVASELSVPEEFQGTLRPYQVKGFSWLARLRQWGLGACLADDMGLGKTVQFLVFLLCDKAQQPERAPTLLICPTSVVGNWQREVQRFAPSLRVLVHHGTGRQTGADFARAAARHDLVISTYSLAHRDTKHLAAAPWRGVVLDEAQNIKNPSAKQTQAVRQLPAAYRMALTGTPVENRLSELWSIMEFLNPRYLGPAATFRKRFAIPIERYQDEERRAQLRRMVAPFVLRRLKTDPRVIQDLPEKMEMKVFCPLTREQATLYEAVVREMMDKIEHAQGIDRRGQVLAALLKLKQVCNHPAQFLKDGSAVERRSGKLKRLEEMLEEALAEGDRSLVFTQFYEMGELLRRRLQKALGRAVLFLHGGVPQKRREQMIAQFQEADDGPPIFLLSLKAGGVGLNLMRANRVFHFDRWWNPAVENQATDRAFRIGQTRNVQVHKFVCIGTVEERIDAMIEAKKELAQSIIGTGEDWITEMSTNELRDLFQLRREALSVEE